MSDLIIHGDHLPAISVDPASDVKGVGRFDYGLLPEEEAQALRESRTRIHTEKKNTAEAYIAIGRQLRLVKKIVGHGRFRAWVESECGFCLRTAQNYMTVARLADKNAPVALLPLNSAYRMTGRRTSRWMLNTAAEGVADGNEMTEAAFERLYKMFLDSKKRRARRESRGLDRNADRKSEGNVRTPIAGRSSRAVVADISRDPFLDATPAELAEERAQWILRTCGEQFASSLVAMRDCGGLDDAVRVLKTKLAGR